MAEEYFYILEDLLLSHRIPVFTKRAKRRMAAHPKFFLFDTGVYRAIRPKGPLDRSEEIDGSALETLFFQELRANNDLFKFGYTIYYWRTDTGHEVDFVLYGEKGLIGIEIKRASKIRNKEFNGLKAFKKDYPMANLYMFYGGNKELSINNIKLIPINKAILLLPEILKTSNIPQSLL